MSVSQTADVPLVVSDASSEDWATIGVKVLSPSRRRAQGTNLTKERERYYLVWPDQVLHTGTFESRYTVGVRARL